MNLDGFYRYSVKNYAERTYTLYVLNLRMEGFTIGGRLRLESGPLGAPPGTRASVKEYPVSGQALGTDPAECRAGPHQFTVRPGPGGVWCNVTGRDELFRA